MAFRLPGQSLRQTRRTAVGLTLILTLQCLLLVPGLGLGIGIDFGGTLCIAQQWLSGTSPYRVGVGGGRPPLIYSYLSLGIALFGQGTAAVVALRIGLAASFLATTVALFILSRDLIGRGWGLAACLIFVLNPLLLAHSSEVHTSTILLFLQTMAILLCVRGCLRPFSLLGAGIFAGLSFLAFQPGVSILAFFVLVALLGFERVGLPRPPFGRTRSVLLILSGSGLVWLPAIMIQAIQGDLEAFIYCVFKYPAILSARGIAVSGSTRLYVVWRSLIHLVRGPGGSPVLQRYAGMAVATLVCVSLAFAVYERRRRYAFFQAWLALGGGSALVLIREPWSSHYLISLLPIIALLAGAGASRLHGILRFPPSGLVWHSLGKAWVIALVGLLVSSVLAGGSTSRPPPTLHREAALASLTRSLQPGTGLVCLDWLGYYFLWQHPPPGSLTPVLNIQGRATPIPLFILSHIFQSGILGREEVTLWTEAIKAEETSVVMVEAKNWARIRGTPALAPLAAYLGECFAQVVCMDLPDKEMLVFLREPGLHFSIWPSRGMDSSRAPVPGQVDV